MVSLEDQHTTFTVKTGGKVELEEDASFRVGPGCTLIIEDGAEFRLKEGSSLQVADGGKVIVHNSIWGKGLFAYPGASIDVSGEGKITVEANAHLWLLHDFSQAWGGLILNDTASELHVKGLLRTGAGADMHFEGNGFIGFSGNPRVETHPTAKIRQSGQGTNDILFKLSDYANVLWNTDTVFLEKGKIAYGEAATLNVSSPAASGEIVLAKMNLQGPPPVNGAAASIALNAINFKDLKLEATSINNFNQGCQAQGTGTFMATGSLITDILSEGIKLSGFKVSVLDHTTIRNCSVGVKVNSGRLGIRNHTVIEENEHGVEAIADYTSPIRIYVGVQGCGWIINNRQNGITGRNALLDIDAVHHQGSSDCKQINRFDGNTNLGGKIFNICYDWKLQPAKIDANGNYWGGSAPDPQDYVLGSKCDNLSTFYPLETNTYISCEPVNCEHCINEPACNHSRMAAITEQADGQYKKLQVNIWPNPVTSVFHLRIDESGCERYYYRITDVFGRVVGKGGISAETTEISVSGFAKGAYSMVIVSEDGSEQAARLFVVE